MIKDVVSARPFSLMVGLAFFLLSWVSRSIFSLFSLVVLIGLAFPPIWSAAAQPGTKFWGKSARAALVWGIGSGVISSLLGVSVLQKVAVPANLGLQLLVGIPLWFLIVSPFQEFFFRGWMQTVFSDKCGKWAGLIAANLCFTAWHYLSPILDLAPYPLQSIPGVVSTFTAGLIYGYAYQRSQHILAPWLGHAISGIVFILIGAVDLAQVFLST